MATVPIWCWWALWVTSTNVLGRIIEDVTILTNFGELVGRRHQENYDIGPGKITDVVDVFLGIPYAAPPIGDLRFKPPHPPDSWEGSRDAGIAGPVCPQVQFYNQTALEYQSEDCLNLNIYSPYQSANSSAQYPVMLFIHGGSYEEGAGSRYNGFTLAQHGVVVVTINYRLGLLGYLTNGKSSLPGNYGLLDQIEALRWVSENIGHFHGDKCKVTIFGSSAGSTSVGLLLISPKTRGLFHNAILQSGSPLSFWAVYNSTVNYTQFFINVTDTHGCQNESLDDRLDCIKTVHFTNFTYHYMNYTRLVPSQLNFKPRIDGDILPDWPHKQFTSGRYQNITIMIGVVQDEWARSMGWFFQDLANNMEDIDDEFDDGFERHSFVQSVHHVIEKRFWWPKEVADTVVYEYTDWTNISDPYVNRENYKQFMSDLAMVAPSLELADLLVCRDSKVYFYNFNHSSIQTEPPWWKVYHSIELDAVFGSAFNGFNIAVDDYRDHTYTDRSVSRTMMSLWTSFAQNGNPVFHNDKGTSWTPLNAALNNYLYIGGDRVMMRNHLRADKMAFWNFLMPYLREIPFPVNETVETVSKARKSDRVLTLMWFFGILSFLSFGVTIAIVIRNGTLQKKLTKALAMVPEAV